MKTFKILLLSLFICGLVFPVAFAAGNAENGKALFNDPKAFNGSVGKSCGSCHPNGKGLENAGMEKGGNTPAGKSTSLEDTINGCIVMANKGKAIDPKSAEMKDVVAYIKSLGKK
jgi:mono/diheme cytochrome c family protein